MSENKTVKVKTVHMAVGLDLLGSKTSFQAGRNYDIEATQIGIKIHSRTSGRTIVVPYPNVKGFELLSEGASVSDGKMNAAHRAEQALQEARNELIARGETIVTAPVIPQVSEEEQMLAANEARKAARKAAKEQALKQQAEENAKLVKQN